MKTLLTLACLLPSLALAQFRPDELGWHHIYGARWLLTFNGGAARDISTDTSRTTVTVGGNPLLNNNVIVLDGTGDRVVISAPTKCHPSSGDWSFACWFKSTASVDYDVLFEWAYAGDAISLRWRNARLYAYLMENSTEHYMEISAGSTLNDGIWHHVFFVWYGGSTDDLLVYVDGALRQTFNRSSVGSFDFSVNNAFIGDDGSNGRNFTGTLDEIMWFNRAPNADEIKNYYEATKPYH
jgi:hypothetical protein